MKSKISTLLILLLLPLILYAATRLIPKNVATTAAQSYQSGTQEDIGNHIRGSLPWATPKGTRVTAVFSDGTRSTWVVMNMASTVGVVPLGNGKDPVTPGDDDPDSP